MASQLDRVQKTLQDGRPRTPECYLKRLELSVRLEPGQLVLFPSWLLHDVKPFQGEGERITVAFNCWFSLEDPPPGR